MTRTIRITRFWIVGAGGIAVQMAMLALLVYMGGVDYIVATVISVAAAVTHNFLWHRLWTWRDRREHGSALAAFGRFVTANGIISVVGNLAVMFALVSLVGMPVVAANAIAIAVCGAANYWVADTAVFTTA